MRYFKQIINNYTADKKLLDATLRDYVYLSKFIDRFKTCGLLEPRIQDLNDELKGEFIEINCEIQNLRSDNDAMIDQIKAQQQTITEKKEILLEKEALSKLFDDQIKSLNE